VNGLQDQLSGRNHGPRKGSLDASLLILCRKLIFIAPQYLDLFLLVCKGREGTLQAEEILKQLYSLYGLFICLLKDHCLATQSCPCDLFSCLPA
jgi:hypothetical protein